MEGWWRCGRSFGSRLGGKRVCRRWWLITLRRASASSSSSSPLCSHTCLLRRLYLKHTRTYTHTQADAQTKQTIVGVSDELLPRQPAQRVKSGWFYLNLELVFNLFLDILRYRKLWYGKGKKCQWFVSTSWRSNGIRISWYLSICDISFRTFIVDERVKVLLHFTFKTRKLCSSSLSAHDQHPPFSFKQQICRSSSRNTYSVHMQ